MISKRPKTSRQKVVIVLAILAAILLIIWVSIKPSNNRRWTIDQSVLPYADIKKGDKVLIYNIRNFAYTSTTDYMPSYYNRTFDLNKIKSVDYVVEPFSNWAGSAHTFLTFGFEGNSAATNQDDQYVSISIEIRKEVGESFSAFKGLFKQYELIYVIADERDVIKLRTNFRKDQVYLYPVKTTPEKARALFLDMVQSANDLKRQPRFYNTLTDTCTTRIADHVNKISPKKIPFSFKVLFPGYSDRLAYDLGIINTDLSFEAARAKFNINERAMKYADDPKFSRRIRE